ncbi:MAG: 50S ribosomal protein L22 [Candidatus Micrarchaeota archaeon]|nr:50S ribosomal protein L22 [Candidatus Micrarchaeota archaeon]
MAYSINYDKSELAIAHAKDINASMKDLCAVCDSIRYRSFPQAIAMLDSVIHEGKPIVYRRHNTRMGSRHEIGGKKGRYPKKCAMIVRKVLINAGANADNKGYDSQSMYVVHAAANKTQIAMRTPSKGILYISGGYGYAALRRSDLELARVEIALGRGIEKGLGANVKRRIERMSKAPQLKIKAKEEKKPKPKKAEAKKPVPTAKPLPAAKPAEKAQAAEKKEAKEETKVQ